MQPSFRHDEMFPIIARLIIHSQGDVNGFVGHDTIVATSSVDPEAAAIVSGVRGGRRHGTTTALRPPTWSLGFLSRLRWPTRLR